MGVYNRRYRMSMDTRMLTSYKKRQIGIWATDIICILISTLITSLLLKLSLNLEQYITYNVTYIILSTISFITFKCYSSLWKYAGEEEVMSVIIANIAYMPIFYALNKLPIFERSILFYVINIMLITISTISIRVGYRTLRRIKYRIYNNKNKTKVLIIGAGNTGEIIIKEIMNSPKSGKKVVGILDDDTHKIGKTIHDVKILESTMNLNEIVKKYDIDEIIFAISNISNIRKKYIIQQCKETKCTVRTVPGILEIIDGKVDIKQVKDVDIEQLLGREPIDTDVDDIKGYIENRVVLVTGGGGSIGSELCRQIASFNPKTLIILDNYENNAYAIQQELYRKYKNTVNIKTIIASVREEKRMDNIFNTYKPEIVFHAAAHKHVPLMEDSPTEAIKNNIFGTLNIAKMCRKHRTKKMVLVSTDKAVNPTNIMGATKRAAEMIIQTMNQSSYTEFVAVRFGNVLGSNGSVIPLFKKQIAENGPITITHPDIIRYFMTIPEAVQLVIQAGNMAKGGEIFVLDMGKPVKIVDLAKNLIKLSGLEEGVDIEIEYTGLRPGEKLYEELLMNEEGLVKTDNKKIFIGQQMKLNKDEIMRKLRVIEGMLDIEQDHIIDMAMRNLVTTYIRPEEVNEKII